MRKFLFLSCMLMLASLFSWAQRSISGRVTDANGNPIPGASVQVKSTRIGTVTKEDGTFTLTVPANGRTLVISAVGQAAQEVAVSGQSNISVSMQAGTERNLQEVVVTGYGTQSRKSFTGSASKVNAQQISTLMTPSVDKELGGRAAGVQVTNSSGTVNAPAT